MDSVTHGEFTQSIVGRQRAWLATWLLLLLLRVAQAAVYQVPSEIADLQQALDACQSGDTVLVARGEYHGLFALPECDVHLYSHHVLTGDTLDVEETILDGDSLGSILSSAEDPFCIDVQGFTFRHGLGREINDVSYSGGIDAQASTKLRVDHCVFRECHASWNRGAAIQQNTHQYPRTQLSLVSNCTIVDCYTQTLVTWTWPGAVILRADSVVVHDFEAYSTTTTGFTALYAYGTSYLECDDVLVHDMRTIGDEFLQLKSDGNALLRDVFVQNCRLDLPYNDGWGICGGFVHAYVDFRLIAKNIEVSNCICTTVNGVPCANGAVNALLGGHLEADSVIIRGCHLDTGELLSIGTVGTLPLLASDCVRNLKIEDCTWGQEVYQGETGSPATMRELVYAVGVNMYDCLFRGITSMTFDLPPTGPMDRGNVIGGILFHYGSSLPDTIRLIRTQFVDNLVIDRDANNTGAYAWQPNSGRSIITGAYFPRHVYLIDSCQFIEQRQPNWIPEWDDGAMTNEVGSMIYHNGSGLVIRNSLFQGIDDGCVYALGDGDFIIENSRFLDVDRSVIVACPDTTEGGAGGNVFLRNLLLQNSQQRDCFLQNRNYSLQRVLHIGPARRVVVENCTWLDCNQIGMIGGEPISHDIFEGVYFRNCLIQGNSYEFWQAGGFEYADSLFYCVSQEERNGAFNLFGIETVFDPQRGIPFLAEGSPCIDAGNPDAAYNDIEDPDAPGFALWPSQGGLRNDIGCTGGPYAAVREFVSVSPRRASTLPTSPTLGDAYPNPFNPTTTIPFVIQQPTHLRLSVYNLRGQLVATLADGEFLPGEHRVTFDGAKLASGVYFISLHGEGVMETRKVLLLK